LNHWGAIVFFHIMSIYLFLMYSRYAVLRKTRRSERKTSGSAFHCTLCKYSNPNGPLKALFSRRRRHCAIVRRTGFYGLIFWVSVKRTMVTSILEYREPDYSLRSKIDRNFTGLAKKIFNISRQNWLYNYMIVSYNHILIFILKTKTKYINRFLNSQIT